MEQVKEKLIEHDFAIHAMVKSIQELIATKTDLEKTKMYNNGNTSKNISFGLETSGSGTPTSGALDDYEEGTWTGAVQASVKNPTNSPSMFNIK
jgi:hypothetical protein